MQRPAAVTVFGILNIVFGTLGLICMPLSMLVFVLPGQERNPVVCLVRESTPYLAFMIASSCAGILATGSLLAAGIGLLQMKEWARVTSIVYGIYALVMGIAGTVVNAIFVFAPMVEESSGPEAAIAVGSMVGGLVGGCIGLIYPIVLLVFMTRPAIRDALRARTETVM